MQSSVVVLRTTMYLMLVKGVDLSMCRSMVQALKDCCRGEIWCHWYIMIWRCAPDESGCLVEGLSQAQKGEGTFVIHILLVQSRTLYCSYRESGSSRAGTRHDPTILSEIVCVWTRSGELCLVVDVHPSSDKPVVGVMQATHDDVFPANCNEPGAVFQHLLSLTLSVMVNLWMIMIRPSQLQYKCNTHAVCRTQTCAAGFDGETDCTLGHVATALKDPMLSSDTFDCSSCRCSCR